MPELPSAISLEFAHLLVGIDERSGSALRSLQRDPSDLNSLHCVAVNKKVRDASKLGATWLDEWTWALIKQDLLQLSSDEARAVKALLGFDEFAVMSTRDRRQSAIDILGLVGSVQPESIRIRYEGGRTHYNSSVLVRTVPVLAKITHDLLNETTLQDHAQRLRVTDRTSRASPPKTKSLDRSNWTRHTEPAIGVGSSSADDLTDSKELSSTKPPSTAQADLPRDREVEKSVLEGRGLYLTLRTLYPRFEPLIYAGSEFPIWSKPAAPDDWENLDSALGQIASEDGVSPGGYPPDFDAPGREKYEQLLKSQKVRSLVNNPTYALERIDLDGEKVKVYAKHGTYFQSLASSESLEAELMDALAKHPDQEVSLDDLPRRKWLHDAVGGQHVVLDGRNRSAALSVSATILIAEPDGTYSALLAQRSERVATHPSFFHVAPSGIFAPLNDARRNDADQFSIVTSILREYAEELFHYVDLEQGDGLGIRELRDLAPVRELLKAQDESRVSLHYCGLSVPLLTLRPEFSILIFIRDRSWLVKEIRRSKESDHWFSMNWEYESNEDVNALKLPLDAAFQPIDLESVRPSVLLPHAAAALYLSTSVAASIVGA